MMYRFIFVIYMLLVITVIKAGVISIFIIFAIRKNL